MLRKVKYWLRAASDVLLPRVCPVCNHALGGDEQYLCRRCLSELPRTHFEEKPFNSMEQLFAGKVQVEHAAALFNYHKGSAYTAIIHDIKYRNMARMGVWMGAHAVQLMRGSGFFNGIDVVVPVPLHIDKMMQRGYNQAEMIARGIANETGATLVCALKAVKPHATQTRKGAYERWLNTRDTVTISHNANRLAGKHVLLVDDVITTGATLISCAEALTAIPGITISIFTLTAAQLD